MSTTGLDLIREQRLTLIDHPTQVGQRGNQTLVYTRHGTDMDSGRDHVVGALAHVDVIVGVNLNILLRRQGGDDLVHIHVSAGARPGLITINGELVSEFTVYQAVTGRNNRVPQIVIQ